MPFSLSFGRCRYVHPFPWWQPELWNPFALTGYGRLAQAYALLGQRAKAMAILQTLLTRSVDGRPPALAISKIYFALGDKARGFYWLEKSVDEHELTLDLKARAVIDAIRSGPRFSAVLRRMNLT
jgi:hypothetical protein